MLRSLIDSKAKADIEMGEPAVVALVALLLVLELLVVMLLLTWTAIWHRVRAMGPSNDDI